MAEQGSLGFDKIAAEGKIKAYKRDNNGLTVSFKDVYYADGHRDFLDRLMDDKIGVRVTIEVVDPTAFETG
jgi:hypothetical protein